VNPALFLADVEQVPATLTLVAGRLRVADPWADVDLHGIERVLLLGMGSSRYAAETVALSMRAAGLNAIAEPASIEAGWPAGPNMLVVAVSATGGSIETLTAASRYRDQGRLVALVENTGSPLAEMAHDVVPLEAGSEAGGVACRSYRHTLVQLLALRARLTGGSLNYLADGVLRAAEATADLLERRDTWLPPMLEALDGPDGIAVIAPAERRSSAEQSALMVREGPRRPATASETGDWAHVDVYLAKTLDYRVLLLPGSRWEGQAMEWLIKRGSRVVPVGAELDGAGPGVRYRYDDNPLVRLLTEVTVAELVAANWWTTSEAKPV
jgi:glucosamine--fructose-6-phosphate aminotransferase (isomerizing)